MRRKTDHQNQEDDDANCREHAHGDLDRQAEAGFVRCFHGGSMRALRDFELVPAP